MILTILLLTLVQFSTSSLLWSNSKDEVSHPSIRLTKSSVEHTGSSYTLDASEKIADADLTSFNIKPYGDKSEVYMKAVELLGSLQSAPSCTRIATSNLLTSCQSIEAPSTDVETAMDDVKAMYAAHLAICELRAAKAQIPDHCSFISSSAESGKVTINEKFKKRHLSPCIHSLEGRPQWWTSYSNNIQNAVLICRATRIDIEKNEMIKILKSMVATSLDVEETLSRSLQEASQRLDGQREFTKAADAIQQQLLHELAQSNVEAKTFFGRLMENAEMASHSMLAKVSSAFSVMDSEIARLNEVLHTSSKEASEIHLSIRKVFQQILQGNSELAASQTRGLEQNRDVAVQLQSSLESMRGNEVVALLETLNSIHNQLQSTNELVSNLHSRQDMIDQRLAALNTSFENLETKAITVSENLALIDASASNVSSTLTELTSFGGVFRTLIQWKWPLVLIILVSIYDRSWAAIIAALFLTLYLILDPSLPSIIPDITIVHYGSGYHLKLRVLIKAVSVTAIACLAGIIVKVRNRKVPLPASGFGLQSWSSTSRKQIV